MAVLAVACLSVGGHALSAEPAETKPAGSFQISAWTFDRGNAWVRPNPDMYADYRDKFPQLVVGDGGELPWAIEYDIDFPVDTTYTLHVCYGSPEKRPIQVWLDGHRVGTCCGRVTGNPPPYMDRHPQHNLPRDATDFHGLEWEEACKLRVNKGKHTLKFTREGLPPRVHALRVESPVALPKDWKLAAREPKLDQMQVNCRRIFLPPNSVNVEALRLAIEDRTAQFGPEYPQGPQLLKQLADLAKQQRAVRDGTPEQQQEVEKALAAVRSRAMLAHPALKFDKLLFVKQKSRSFSTYTGHLTKGDPGGNLCVLSPVSADGKVTELVPELPNGVVGRFDLSFDATKVVFCHAREGGLFRIYEIDIDPKTGRRVSGSRLRQLTHGGQREAKTVEQFDGVFCGHGYDDIDPIYLPTGNIMFASTRSERSVLCFPATVTTLHLMDADGKNIRCISRGQVNEINPCVLSDGRVVYMRWEYVDKGFGNAQSLWSIHPDGSGSDHVYKNSLVRPGAMTNACSIPGSQRLVAIAAGHHGGMAGPVVLVDGRCNRRNAQGLTNITPEISYPGLFPMKSNGGPFREPYPFSEKFFLVSHRPAGIEYHKGADYGIYVLDAWGNRAELYRDPDLSCHQPTPLRPRRKPTTISSVADTDDVDTRKAKMEGLATVFLLDVYQGMTGIERGRVKYIRVMDALNLGWYDTWRAGKQGDSTGQQASAVSLGGDVAVKKTHGIATVREDGSAFFTVPANENLFFQALDENYMELQRMRTFINLMPGENRSCVGCHEVRRHAPNLRRANPMALDYPVETLYPQPGDTGPRTVHYARDVQPIFDKHCIGCHSGEKPEGDLVLTGELTGLWNRSYENLTRKNLVSYLHTCGFGSSHVPPEPPLTFGSHRSRLVERIRQNPCKANITREEFIRIVTWIDANAPYYGTHEGKKNLKWKDEPDFRPLPVAVK
jgi:hypothetical protein